MGEFPFFAVENFTFMDALAPLVTAVVSVVTTVFLVKKYYKDQQAQEEDGERQDRELDLKEVSTTIGMEQLSDDRSEKAYNRLEKEKDVLAQKLKEEKSKSEDLEKTIDETYEEMKDLQAQEEMLRGKLHDAQNNLDKLAGDLQLQSAVAATLRQRLDQKRAEEWEEQGVYTEEGGDGKVEKSSSKDSFDY